MHYVKIDHFYVKLFAGQPIFCYFCSMKTMRHFFIKTNINMRKKIYFFAALLPLLLGASDVMADTYKVDFETTVDTSAPEFRVAEGWTHVVDGYIDPWFSNRNQYVSYEFAEGEGVDGSTALKIDTQNLNYEDKNDLLVTPKVSGTVSIMVKSAAEPYDEEEDWFGAGPQQPSIKFYAVSDGTMGDEITPAEAPEIVADGYVKYVLPEQDGVCIGIRGEYVYIDNFEAASAEIDKVRSLKVVGGQLADDNKTEVDDSQLWNVKTYVLSNATGDYTLSYDIELTNTGDITLTPGDADYTVTILNQESGEVIAENLPVNVTIEPSQTETANVKMPLNINTTGDDFYLLIRENITRSEMGYYDFHVQAKVDESDTTGLRMATATTTDGQAAYTLGGRQAQPGRQHGLVIMNGKKFNQK